MVHTVPPTVRWTSSWDSDGWRAVLQKHSSSSASLQKSYLSNESDVTAGGESRLLSDSVRKGNVLTVGEPARFVVSRARS